jgi:hypothetical protein
MRCCTMRHVSMLGGAAFVLLVCAGGGALVFLLLLVGVCGRRMRHKAAAAIALPTYGLPAYNGRSGSRGGGW